VPKLGVVALDKVYARQDVEDVPEFAVNALLRPTMILHERFQP
jgi:hypothetical protein